MKTASIRLQAGELTARDLDRMQFWRRRGHAGACGKGMRASPSDPCSLAGRRHLLHIDWSVRRDSGHITFCVRCQASSLQRLTFLDGRTCT